MALRIFFVKGDSMLPYCHEGDFVLVESLSYLLNPLRQGDLVILGNVPGAPRYIIKRVTNIKDAFVWVEGDNKEQSTDSRAYGWIPRSHLLGRAHIVRKGIVEDV